ncbi:hypothetical protein OIU74_019711 [Salix koriyanagi]|uniref:ENT domain-containing protein n=1 Tax=Salix koriyanagi TaxID=2511006 RepID=A0A9Q0P4C7_9ROSI|nr:hypothetical protein OIU74_019711 [Salix koriyanagi]
MDRNTLKMDNIMSKWDLDRHHLQRSSKDLVSCMEGCHKQLVPNLPFFEGADNISPEKLMVDEKFKGSIKMNTKMVKETTELLYTSSTALLAEDSNQSSVASCSSNGFADSSSHNFQTPLDNASHESDAGSSFLSFSFIKRLTPYFEQKLEAEIHELEFHAYRSTVQALYASGPLSWEQESLLTNLRLSLHISDEEHLLHLRQLLSTQVLACMALVEIHRQVSCLLISAPLIYPASSFWKSGAIPSSTAVSTTTAYISGSGRKEPSEPLESITFQGNNISSFVLENVGISQNRVASKISWVKMQRAVSNKMFRASEIHQKLRTTTMLRLVLLF